MEQFFEMWGLILCTGLLARPTSIVWGFSVSPLPNHQCRQVPSAHVGQLIAPSRESIIRYRRQKYEYWEEQEDILIGEKEEEDLSPGEYNVRFQGGYTVDQADQPEWELCDDDSTWVLLPPAYVERPTAVIHFVGGTFFGSSPKLWYGPLLEGIVSSTQCAIVATGIPVSLTESPLQHVTLSRKLQRQFQEAYVEVLDDEYGMENLDDVPVVALGHSLGSRLLTVLATLSPPKNAPAPPYKSYILISFTNYEASASIPGVLQLMKSRLSLDRSQSKRPIENRRQPRPRRRDVRDDDDFYNEDVLFDNEIDEMIKDIQGSFYEQTHKFRDALTPRTLDLEFCPTPDQLWDALESDNRYTINQTLIIQFEDDEVDQSAKLASCLMNSTDLKFARLRGSHLAPVSLHHENKGVASWLELPTKATRALWGLLSGESDKTARRKSRDLHNLRDLRQSIIRYISDVATK